jgi:ubiquinone/menaquinone biosynthesis C-methylase UbiE
VSPAHAPGDHFSSVSAAYSAFRPRYPRALFEFLTAVAPRHRLAWDCGAGTGQATVNLAEYFDRVIGTDISAEQIARASRHEKITWLVCPAESTPLASGSVDLVTIAQALHWFDHARFNAEVRRVGAPRAVIAAWAYGAPLMDGEVGAVLRRAMFDTLGPYWPPERRHVYDEYRSIPFPFERIASPVLSLEEEWSAAQVAGYVRTWSATTKYRAAHVEDPVVAIERELAVVWGDPDRPRRIAWPLIVIAGQIG